MHINIESNIKKEQPVSIDVELDKIDISVEKDEIMKSKLQGLLGKISDTFESQKDSFVEEILEHKDKLGFGLKTWMIMEFTELFIESNSRNKTMCIAICESSLDKK